MECDLSSGSDVTVYSYIPIEEDQENYLLGYDEYVENFCWPGYSPLYSYFYEYPENLPYAFSQALDALDDFYYDWTGNAGYKKSEKKETPKVESESAGFTYYNLGQEIVKILRYSIDHMWK